MIRYLNIVTILSSVLSATFLILGGFPKLIFQIPVNEGPPVFQHISISPEASAGMFFGGFAFLALIFSIILNIRKLLLNSQRLEGLDKETQIQSFRALLVAVAEGNIKTVRKYTKKVGSASASKGLTYFINAKSAEACGDAEEAIGHYKAMLLDRDYLAIAQRGLAEQFFSISDYPKAIKHAKDAINKNKKSYWAYHIIFQSHVLEADWSKALETLTEVELSKHFDHKAIYRYRAALLSAETVRLSKLNQAGKALNTAAESFKFAPNFPPAVVNYSYLLIASEEFKKAINVIKKSWRKDPHPVYAIIYRNLLEAGKIKNKEKYFDDLIRTNPKHYETQMFKVEQLLHSGSGNNALKLLSPYLSNGGDNERVCLLAANAEALKQNNLGALEWLQKAITAPKDLNWSDINSEGVAFDYTKEEWVRLINLFGKKAELMHARYEKSKKTLLPIKVVNSEIVVDKKRVINEKPSTHKGRGHHQEEKFEILIPDGLAQRLESLLEPSKKPK